MRPFSARGLPAARIARRVSPSAQIAEEPPLVAQPVHGTRFGEKLVEGATMGLRHAVPRLSGAPREHVSRRSNVYPFHGAANRAEQNLRHLQYVGLADVLAVDGTVADESEVGRERRADFTGQFAQGRENVAGRIGEAISACALGRPEWPAQGGRVRQRILGRWAWRLAGGLRTL